MASFPFYRQLDQMDCGPACLQMVAQHHGRYYPLQQLRSSAFITCEGVSLLGISEAAESIGFRTLGVRIPFDKLLDVPLPAIVHWNQNHFAVVYRIGRDKVHVADPATGLIQYSAKEFISNWHNRKNGGSGGIAILLEPTSEFYSWNSIFQNSER